MLRLLEQKKKVIFAFVLSAFLLLFTACEFYRILGFHSSNIGMIKGYTVIALLSIAFLTVFYFLVNYRDIKIEKLFLIVTAFGVLLYMIIFSPFTVPDEPTHYLSAYHLSNAFLFKPSQLFSDQLILRKEDYAFYSHLSTKLDRDLYLNIASNFSLFAHGNATVKVTHIMETSAPLGYVASALGITLSRIFHLGAIPSIYVGRFFNAASCIFIGYLAIKRIPYGKAAVLALYSLPMTMHLLASYSYDGTIIAVAVYFIAQFLYIKEKDGVASKKDIILLVLSIALLAPMKLVYLPITFLVLLIPKEKLSISTKTANLIKLLAVLSGIAALLIVQMPNIISRVFSTNVQNYSGEGINYSTSWALSHIKDTVNVFVNTIINKSDFYISTFVGSGLGWFQIGLPMYLYLPFIILMLLCVFRREGEPKPFDFASKLFTVAISLVVCGLVLYSLFVIWTAQGSPIIEGVQGRYFLPTAFLLFLILRNGYITVKPKYDKYIAFMFAFLNYLAVTAAFTRILTC